MSNYSTNSFPTNRWGANDGLNALPQAIASLDAAIRSLFGLSTSALTQAMVISDAGAVRLTQSLQIGNTSQPIIIDVSESIGSTVGSNEDVQLATVEAIRAFVAAQIAAI
jgi:hypothetical protein